jgi:Reverse transcriptase (RNA-dependent DNA polymerase)
MAPTHIGASKAPDSRDPGVPIHVNDLLLASNSKSAIQNVKRELASHFKLHDQGPATSILGMKIERNRPNRSISPSQPGYIKSILERFGMADCNPALTPMEENIKLSIQMSPTTVEGRLEMKSFPYRELIGKLLYLAIATRPDIAYVIGVLCRFVENPVWIIGTGTPLSERHCSHDADLFTYQLARPIHYILRRRSQWQPG